MTPSPKMPFFSLPILALFCLLLGLSPNTGMAQATQGRCLKGNCQSGNGVYLDKHTHLYQGGFANGRFQGAGILSGPSETYIGQFDQGLKSGQGTLANVNGRVYQGLWQSDLPQGQGVEISTGGDIYEGEWQKGKKHGTGIAYLSNGQIHKGTFAKNNFEKTRAELQARVFQRLGSSQAESYLGQLNFQGQPEGYGTWSNQGKITGKGRFEKGQPSQAFYLSDGKKHYLGNLLKFQMHGQGVLLYPNGDRYLGDFYQDQLKGQGMMLFKNQEVFLGSLSKNKPEGQGQVFFPNGDVFSGGFVQGLKQGPGQLSSGGKTIHLLFEKDKPVQTQSGQPVPKQTAAPLSDAVRLQNQRNRWRNQGKQILVDKVVNYATRYQHDHAGYIKLKAGQSCEVLVGGPPGSEQAAFQLTSQAGSQTEWVYSKPSEHYAGTRLSITENITYSLWVKARMKGQKVIPIQVLMACD